jgi:hypothetical protein
MNTLLVLIYALLAGVIAVSKLRNRSYYTRAALLSPDVSPWNQIYTRGSDRDFLQSVSVSRHVFNNVLLFRFAPMWDSGISRVGRRRKVLAHFALAMVLEYLSSEGKQYELCRIYGVTEATVSRTLTLALPMLNQLLKELPEARVRFPDEEERNAYTDMIVRREPLIAGKKPFGWVDGTTFRIDQPADAAEQNGYYSGAKADCVVSSIFVYAPDGTVIWARINCPGSWHDSKIARPLYDILERIDGSIIADSAFPRTNAMEGKIIRSYKRDEVSANARVAKIQEVAHRVITSLRQAVEWGNRSEYRPFVRCRTVLQIFEGFVEQASH